MLRLDLRCRTEGLWGSGFGHLDTIEQSVTQPGHLSMVFRTSCIGITISTKECRLSLPGQFNICCALPPAIREDP